MREDIKKRIEAVRHGEVPEGYRRSKDIGIAPLDWKVGQMSDVLHNETRAVPKPDEPYWRLGIRSWAKGTFQAYVDDPKTVDMDELYVVWENDLVVNITFAWEHAIAVASKEDDGLLVSHRFPTYVFDGGNVPQYYKAVVSQRFFKDMLDHISPGGAGRNRVLNRKDFLALPCYIPSIAEQQKIAEILTTCDRVIELKQQLLEEKRLQKQWLRQRLLTPQQGWRKATIGQIALVTTGATPDTKHPGYWGGNIRWMNSGELNLKHVYEVEGRITDTGLKKSGTKIIPVNCVLIGLAGQGKTRGTAAINHVELCTNQSIAAIHPGNQFDSEYLYHYLDSKYLELRKISSGDGARGGLNLDLIEGFVIYLPDLETQRKIADMLTVADDEMLLLEQERDEWMKKKKSLMQLLLTGLVRVNA